MNFLEITQSIFYITGSIVAIVFLVLFVTITIAIIRIARAVNQAAKKAQAIQQEFRDKIEAARREFTRFAFVSSLAKIFMKHRSKKTSKEE